jgi:phage terminase large subunit
MSQDQEIQEIEVDTGYRPRDLQYRLHQQVRRFNVLVMHRRFGKSVWAINHMIARALKNPRQNPQYAYLAPTYGQVKRIAWDYLKHYTRDIPGATPNEAELRVDIPRKAMRDRVRFYLLGAESPDSIRGVYLDGVNLDEYAEMDHDIFVSVLRPALSDRQGWANFIGTPKGKNHFHKLWEFADTDEAKARGWFRAMYKASETGYVPTAELEAARLEMLEEKYQQEFECSFTSALVDAYYAREIRAVEAEGRIAPIPYQRELPVYTAWDIGIGDETAIVFWQEVGRQIHVIDYLEMAGEDLPYFAGQVRGRGYVLYERHYWPHDMNAREFGNKTTRIEQARGLGLSPSQIIPKHRVEDRINAARTILSRCYFDSKKTVKLIEALKGYQKKWNTEEGRSSPMHNWASHGADAFGLMAMARRERQSSFRELPTRALSEYDLFNPDADRSRWGGP